MKTVYMVWRDQRVPDGLPQIENVFAVRDHAATFAADLQKYVEDDSQFIVVPLLVRET